MIAPRLVPVALISLFLGTACGGESKVALASSENATTTAAAPAKAPAAAPAARTPPA